MLDDGGGALLPADLVPVVPPNVLRLHPPRLAAFFPQHHRRRSEVAPPIPPPVAVVVGGRLPRARVRGLGRIMGFGIGETGPKFGFFTVMPLWPVMAATRG